jgi:hypothetical protein
MKNEVGSGSISQRYGSRDPDLHQNVTDPQHRWQRPHTPQKQKSGCQGTGKGTSRALAEVRMSGDRNRDMTYIGRGITGPGDKGSVVRGQERGHHVPWQRHHRPR